MSRSLEQFVMDSRKTQCPVCLLPAAVKKQIDRSNRKVIPVATILEWLTSEHNITITPAEWRSHCSGGHDARRIPKTR